MFEMGSKIFYPMHGAGIIDAIEEKEIMGETRDYYIMSFPHNNMKIMVPTGNEKSSGIRNVVEMDVIDNVLGTFQDEAEEEETTVAPNHRHRANMDKIKSGDIYKAAQVIRDLNQLSKNGNLGTQDKNIFNDAQQFLVSEVIMVKDIDQKQAESLVKKALG